MRAFPGARAPLQSSASVNALSGRSNRAAVFAAALRNTVPVTSPTQAKAEGTTRLDGPDKQAVHGYQRRDGKQVADYLRTRRPRFPMKGDPKPEA